MPFLKIRTRISTICLALLLTACGGGGGSSSSSASKSVSGNAVKGVISQGIVNVYRPGTDGSHQFLGATRTQSDGTFSLDLSSDRDDLLLIELRADGSSTMTCDLMSGCVIPGTGYLADFAEPFALPENFSLLGIKLPGETSAYISPLSHLIVTTAAYLDGGITAQNIAIASEWLQLDLRLDHDPLDMETPDITRLDDSVDSGSLNQGVLSAIFFYHAFGEDWTGHTLTLDDLSLDQVFSAAADLAASLAEHYAESEGQTSNQLASLAETAEALEESFSQQSLTILTQPQSVTIVEGETINLRVTATSESPLQFQWYRGSTMISGATSNNLLIPNAQQDDQGLYHVEVFDDHSRIESLSASVTVHEVYIPLQITSQPQSHSLSPGQSVILSVETLGGNGSLGYQWRKGGSLLPNAQSSSLALINVNSGDAGSYSVTVSDGSRTLESQSAIVSVSSVVEPVTIHNHPDSSTNQVGDSITLQVNASGGGYLGYQWRKDGIALAGQNAATLSINPIQLSDEGSYDVVISNSQGSVVSDPAVVTVLPADAPLTILSQPQSTSSLPGGSASFFVSASAGSDISYQWYHNGLLLSGANSASLTINPVEQENAGVYQVVVSTSSQQESSLGAILSISELAAVELSWDIPTERENGDSLAISEIRGYSIQYGLDSMNPENSIEISGATTTNHTIQNLLAGIYYLRIATIDTDGIRGAYSSNISIEIQ